MKIYIVTHDRGYEGWANISAWWSKEDAERECADLRAKADQDDYYSVEEMTVRDEVQGKSEIKRQSVLRTGELP